MKKKVLIYAPLAVLGHHFETDLELAQRHLDAGDEVHIVGCNSDLRPLQFMGCRGAFRCQLCISRRKQGMSALSKPGEIIFHPIGALPNIEIDPGVRLNTIEAVKGFRYRNFDVGSAYLSSLFSDIRDAFPDMNKYESEARQAIGGICGLVDRLTELLKTIAPTDVYFFNGRFSLYRPMLRLCEQNKINFFTHERGANNSRYWLAHNSHPHDRVKAVVEMRELWGDRNVLSEEKAVQAANWYEKRAAGENPAWRSFTNEQNQSLLPADWDNSKINVACFVSSEDEFAAVPGWEMDLFGSQYEALYFILETFEASDEFVFYIRMHPNLRSLKNQGLQRIHDLGKQFKNCVVISSDSPVGSYNLIRQAGKIVSFGSTVGVEATYWAKPSLSIGKSFYDELEAVHLPKNRDELIQMIRDPELPAGSREGALIYGYWNTVRGVPFIYYQAYNLTTGSFRGQVITGNRLYLALNYFFVMVRDFIKILKGEYSFWHLSGKINNKVRFLTRSRSADA